MEIIIINRISDISQRVKVYWLLLCIVMGIMELQWWKNYHDRGNTSQEKCVHQSSINHFTFVDD